MKIIHLNGFRPHELEHYRKQIFDNLIDGIQACLEAMEDWDMVLSNHENEVSLQRFCTFCQLIDFDDRV